MNLDQITDLVLQSQAGDDDAMEQLLLLAHTPVSYLTNQILHTPQTAQQVTRDVLKTVVSNLSSLPEASHFEQWLCRMTAARCMQAAPLLHRNFAESADSSWKEELADGSALTAEESADAIQNMVASLPESQRLCILLLSCGELTVPAIAQLTGFSEAIIKENIKHGQNAIQQHLWELDTRGIQFTGISSLTNILHDAMYRNADESAAMEMVYGILGKKMPVSPSVRIIRFLTVIIILLLVASLVLGGLIAFKMAQSLMG